MYPRELRGSPRGPSLAAAPQGRWANRAASALPLRFTSLSGAREAGWGRRGRLRRAWGVQVRPPLRPCSQGWRCTRESPAGTGPTPACELSWGLCGPGTGRPARMPRGSAGRCASAWGCRPEPGCGPALEPQSSVEGAASLAPAPSLTDVREEKVPAWLLPGVDVPERSPFAWKKTRKVEVNVDLVGCMSATPRGRESRLRGERRCRPAGAGEGRGVLATGACCQVLAGR